VKPGAAFAAALCCVAGAAADVGGSEGDGPVDHARLIRGLDDAALAAGEKIYRAHCVTCHGSDGKPPSGTRARAFREESLKFGNHPFAMWQTLTHGNGDMPMQRTVLDPEERYQVIHYVREHFLKEDNPDQYFAVDAEYLRDLPEPRRGSRSPTRTLSELEKTFKDPNRARSMDYGPALNRNLQMNKLPDIERAAFVRRDPLTLVYDVDTGNLATAWRGKFLDTGKTHLNSGKGRGEPWPPKGATIAFRNTAPLAEEHRYLGRYHHGRKLIRALEVGDRRILEFGDVLGKGDAAAAVRHFQVGAGRGEVTLRLFDRGSFARDGEWLVPQDAGKGTAGTALRLIGPVEWAGDDARVVVTGARRPVRFSVVMTIGDDAAVRKAASGTLHSPDLGALIRGGERLWKVEIPMAGVAGPNWMGYAADELVIPYRNPWGAWIRPASMAFFDDGRLAVGTWNGDIWILHGIDDDLRGVRWQRAATGLYEPLGLVVVDGVLHARCRHRIWRLHDLDGDGEFDHYENFFTGGRAATGYHAFLFDLCTDGDGNFYYAASGRKSPDYAHFNGVIKVSPDGSEWAKIASGIRHPNGMGISPDDEIVISDNQGDGVKSAGIMWVEKGNWLGYGEKPKGARRAPPTPWIPHHLDTSSGNMRWADPERFGPLSGKMLHTSYGTASMFTIWRHRAGDAHNGYGWRLPHAFRSGIMRVAVNPADGQAYVCGLIGWDFKGRDRKDPRYRDVDYATGALHRLRWTGRDDLVPVDARAAEGALMLRFATAVDAANRKALAKGRLVVGGIGGKKHGGKEVAIEGVDSDGDTVIIRAPGFGTCESFEFTATIIPEHGPEQELELFGTVRGFAD